MSKVALARRLSVTDGYIRLVESSKAKPPTPERCQQIAGALSLSETEKKKLSELAMLGRAREEFKPTLEGKFRLTETLSASKKKGDGLPEDWIRIPLLGTAPAGPKSFGADEVEEWLPVRKEDVKGGKRLYLLRVNGDSMNRAGIENGDLIVVNAERHPKNGDIVVIRVDGDATIKRFYKIDNKRVKLAPDSTNPAHDSQTYDAGKVEIQLRGVVEATYMKNVK